MNIEKELRGTFQRLTPNVLGALPASETTVKQRKGLSDRTVQMIATAASVALLIGAATWGLLYFRDHFNGSIIHSGNTTPTTAPTQPTETVPPTDPQSPISREEALQIARTDAFGSITPAHTVSHAELQDEGSSAVYYIVLDDGAHIYHYWIDGYSGAILQQQETAIIYPVEAYERVMDAEPALAASLHTSVVRLYQDNSRYRYYVELQTDTEIHAFHVDALTGEIADRTVLSLETGIGWKDARDLAFAEKGATPETAEYWDIMLLSSDDAPMYRVCYKFDGYYYEATVGTDPDSATAQITRYEDIDFPQESLPGNHVSWQEARDTLMDSLGLSMDSLSGFDIMDTDASVYSFTFQHEEDMYAYLVPAYDTSGMNGGILPQAHLPMTEIRLRDLALDSVDASLEELWYLETSQEEDQRLYYVSFRCGNHSYFCEVSQDKHISVNPRENPDTSPPGEGTADIVTWQTARDAALAAYGVQMQDIIDIDIGFSTAVASPIYTVSFQCVNESHTCSVDAQSGKVIDPNNPTPPEPQLPSMATAQWQTNPEVILYEDFFSEERNYYYTVPWYETSSNCEWLVMNGDSGDLFEATITNSGICICSDAYSGAFIIPSTERYAGYSLMAADGKYAYIRNTQTILRVDLVSGEETVLLRAENILAARTFGKMVTYYATYDAAQNLTIGQLYLPECRNDVLHSKKQDVVDFAFESIRAYNFRTNQGKISWIMMNPEMLELLRRELADSNSPYRNINGNNYSYYWDKSEDPIHEIIDSIFLMDLQNATGVRAFLRCEYNFSTGTYKENTGIIDYCWFGSDYSHDHYQPDLPDPDAPIACIGQWKDLALKGDSITGAEKAGEYRILRDNYFEGYLYYKSETDGKMHQVTDIPIGHYVWVNDYLLCVTEDHRLIQVNADGSQIRELYRAQFGVLGDISAIPDIYGQGNIYITDGNYIMEIDIENLRSRTVVQADFIYDMWYWGDFREGEVPKLYFGVRTGMFRQQYIINLETGEIEETSFL